MKDMSSKQAKFGVSVLLPVYLAESSARNVARLNEAISSVLRQNFPEKFEIIVIDDGSLVDVASVMHPEMLRSTSLRVVRQARNNGLVYALNAGITHAKYPYIARIDADDQWIGDKIKEQLELFYYDNDLSIVGTGMKIRNEEGVVVEEHIRPGDWAGVLRFFIESGCPFPHGSVVGKTELFRLLGYPAQPKYRHCEDYALWGQWLRFFKPTMIERPYYLYTKSDKSISNIHAEKQRLRSSKVRLDFEGIDPFKSIPENLVALSKSLEIPLIDTGVLLFKMWKYKAPVRMPEKAVELIAMLLPDRGVESKCSQTTGSFTLSDLCSHSNNDVFKQAKNHPVVTALPC